MLLRLLRFLGRPLYVVVESFLVSFLLVFNLLQILPGVLIKRMLRLTVGLKKIRKPAFPSFSFPKVRLPKLPSFYPIRFKLPKVLLVKIPVRFWYFLILTLVALTGIYFAIIKDLPSPDDLITREQVVSTKIYDRHGELLFKIYKNENRSLISLDDLPEHLIQATVAIEDGEFFEHTGVSFRGITRALKRNLFDNKVQGGSTITQQLVKNALLTPEKTLRRKIREVITAIRVELTFDKNEILQMYFNEVGYGGAAYGIEEASQLYFGKSASDLTLPEAALLAGLPAAPTTYSPFGAYPELALSRQHQVLRRMVEEGYSSPEQAEKAKSTKLVFAEHKIDIKAPHFVMYVKDLLVKKYGENMVHTGGLEVYTSIDLNIQELAEKAIEEELETLERLHVTNAAVLVTNPTTGEILAMVGSRDYFDFENDGQVNVTIRPRQPGSAIKVVTYSLALENGFTPATVIEDSPIVYRIPGSPAYAPRNYDNQFHGKVTLRQALANSYNVPAVKILSNFGVVKLIEQGKKMGITTWNDPSRFGLSLTLGGGEVLMTDLATVYGTLANGGIKVDLNPILLVSDYTGEVLQKFSCDQITFEFPTLIQAVEEVDCDGERAVDPMVAYQLTDILSDNHARANAFGLFSVLNIPGNQVAVKTGTSNNLRDNWTIGYSKDFLTAVWVGNNDNSQMSYVASGITGASPIWNRIMSAYLVKTGPHSFSPPSELIKVNVCQLTGTLACSACPNNSEEYFVPGTEPKRACNEDQVNSILNPVVEEGERDRILEGAFTSN